MESILNESAALATHMFYDYTFIQCAFNGLKIDCLFFSNKNQSDHF